MSTTVVHPTAIVSPTAKLGAGVEIGPYCVLSGDVELGDGVRLVSHVQINGPAKIGAGTQVYPYACLGFPPQDYKFGADATTAGIVLGEDCIIRESATVHAASNAETPTRLGDRVFLMVQSHIAHDCTIGSDVILVNGSGIAGHCEVGDKVTLSGACIVHQNVRIGRLAFFAGGTGTSRDVPPFCVVSERQRLGAVNLVGMRRSGMPSDEITSVREAFRRAFRATLPKDELLAVLDSIAAESEAVGEMATFVRGTRSGILGGASKPPRLSIDRARRRDEAALHETS